MINDCRQFSHTGPPPGIEIAGKADSDPGSTWKEIVMFGQY